MKNNENELQFEGIKNAIKATQLKIKQLDAEADVQNRIGCDPNTRTSDTKIARESYRALCHQRNIAISELEKLVQSHNSMARRLADLSAIELEKSWLNKSESSLQIEANSIISEIKISDIEIDKINQEVSKLETKKIGLTTLASELDALKHDLNNMKISRAEGSLFEVNITQLDMAIEAKQDEITVKRNELTDSRYLAAAIDEKMVVLSEAHKVLNSTRKTQITRWAEKQKHLAIKGYMNNVSKLMTSLNKIAACDQMSEGSTARYLVDRLKSSGLYVPTYNGGTDLVNGLHRFFNNPDLDNESNRLKGELEASLEEF